MLVFYPSAFSSVCTDQFQIYEEALGEFARAGAALYGVSCDQSDSQTAFREKLGVSIAQLSDFEPKGAASRAFGAYFDRPAVSHRALVVVGPDGVVAWSGRARPRASPGVNLVRRPGRTSIFDGASARRSLRR